jgi:ribonuclease HI
LLTRIEKIFEDRKSTPLDIFHKLKASMGSKERMQHHNPPRFPPSLISTPSMTQGWFDGAIRDNLGKSRARGWLYKEYGYKVSFKRGIESTINNHVEIITSSTLIKVEIDCGIIEIEVFGDSKLMIAKLLGRTQVLNIIQQARVKGILEITMAFQRIIFIHTFKEKNQVVDQLEKEVVDLQKVH